MRAGLVEGVAMSSDEQRRRGSRRQNGRRTSSVSHLWRGAARARQAGAQAHDDGPANGALGAQLWLLSHLPGGLFSRLYEELGLRPKVGFTPKVQEGMARLGTWMPFRAAQRELASFLGVEVAEATVRLLTELAG